MNVLRTRLRQTETGLEFELNGNWLPLTESGRSSQERLLPYIEQPIYIGLRPEAFALADNSSVTMPLATVEALGHEQLLYFEDSQAIEKKLIVRVQGNRVFSVGANLPLQIRFEELYWFDQEGMAIY
jgi:ABC-type sugar transport system ATPase subunit